MPEPIPGIPDTPDVATINEYALCEGQNLPNHSSSLAGRGKFVRQGMPIIPIFRTKQEAFRYAAYLVILAENHLPDENGSELHTFEEVRKAIRNA